MADFEEALNSLLADPDAMGQIMSLAGKLGMGTESLPAGGAPEKAGPSHPTGRAVSGSPAGLPPMERG